MKKVTVQYQTTLYFEEEIEVPDEYVEDDELTEDGWVYVSDNVSYMNEYDNHTEWMGAEVSES